MDSDSAGYGALAERKETVFCFTCRFESYSTEDAHVVCKTLCDEQQLLAAQRENSFPGLYYTKFVVCEESCRERRDRVPSEYLTREKRARFKACGHRFDLDFNGKCDIPVVTCNFDAPASHAQCDGGSNWYYQYAAFQVA